MDHILYIFALFFATLTCSLCIPEWPSNGCIKKFDLVTCEELYYCTGFVNNPSHDYNYQSEFDSICQHSTAYIYFQSNAYQKNHVYYKHSGLQTTGEIPSFHNDHIRYGIISLDLNDNEYLITPTLVFMPNLSKLNLSNNYLTEAKLSNINELDKLTEIDFSNNAINKISVAGYELAYRNLTKLNLSHNYLATIPDGVFDIFTEIGNLDLSHNYIDALSVLTFEGLKKMTSLYLSNNRITDINSSMLRFNKLQILDLSKNKIKNIKANDFEKLNNLRKLDLSFNSIDTIHKNAFLNLELLNALDVSNNLLEIVSKDTFRNMSILQEINLSKNKFKALQRDLFKGKIMSIFSIQDNNLEGALLKGTFEGLGSVSSLDLSYQSLTSIEDFAFFGLENVNRILLNNNKIESLSNKSFNTLRNLEILDISSNYITELDVNTEDLISLRSLLLQNNNLSQVKPEYFIGLSTLEFLDLSSNKITQLQANSFKSLNDLINFQIANNPISGNLLESTFDGLSMLPNLDISGSLLTIISNNSFEGMAHLKDLNMSHSKINEIHCNMFSNTGAIEVIDLSFNELTKFDINTTELVNLVTLLLNNNNLQIISPTTFKGLPRLNKIIVSHNNIEAIHDNAFLDQKDLRNLDLSFNAALKFNISQMDKSQFLSTLDISGIKTNMTFHNVEDIALSVVEMSYSEIHNITALELKYLENLDYLVLSHNNIDSVKVEAFSNVTLLRILDLSYNKIQLIQPGSFKDCTLLFFLNISHNELTTVSYGIFRGLIYLKTLDMSYNYISDLQNERFYEVTSLSELIVDHNMISSVKADEFEGIHLAKLSIGDNPLPCDVLVKLQRSSISFTITAIRIDESSDENVAGVTCNKDHSKWKAKTTSTYVGDSNQILVDIRDVLRNISIVRDIARQTVPINENSPNLASIMEAIRQSNALVSSEMLNLTVPIKNSLQNFTSLTNEIKKSNVLFSSELAANGNNTNSLLERILKALTVSNTIPKPNPIPVLNENGTAENLIPYINKIKQDLEETIALEKQNVLNEIERSRVSILKTNKESQTATSTPNHDILSKDVPETKSFLFIEICVGLILVILVACILYKFYNSGMFVPRSRSYSTRNLPDNMDNSTL